MKKQHWPLVLMALLLVVAFIVGSKQDADAPTITTSSSGTTATVHEQTYSLTDPTSPWVIVNKQRPLNPPEYIPADLTTPAMALRYKASNPAMQLRRAAADALVQMSKAALGSNIHLKLYSGYRSYEYQKTVYASEVKSNGQSKADTESARPGYSEHQTGWAADVVGENGACPTRQCFANTPEGKWLAANAYKYGFIVRYPPGKQAITGYEYEPWHLRYVGKELSAGLHKKNIATLEEFFKLPNAPNY